MPKLKRKWTPHPKQRLIMNDETRFRVVAAGRRFGKTRMSNGELVEKAFDTPGFFGCYFAPTDDDARELAFDPIVESIPDALLAKDPKRTPPREIELVNGSIIQFRGAKSSSRGRAWDHVTIDEKSEIRNDFWPAVIRPTLADTEGSALFIGTPKGRNKFYELHQRGNDPSQSDWVSYTGTTYDNPHVSNAEVEAARETLPERVFKQEYLAEFASNEGAVFGDIRARNTRPYALTTVTGSGPYATGIDLARSSNYLVAATLDSDGMLVDAMRRRGGSWAQAGRELERYLGPYPGVAYADASRDNKVVEDLARTLTSVQIEPVKFTPQNKADMIENLAARLEIQDIVLPDPDRASVEDVVATIVHELEIFEFETTKAGNVRYGAPEGHHDDTVDALALAAKEVKQQKSTW